MAGFPASAVVPRFSFRYGGKDSGEFLPAWKQHTSTQKADGASLTRLEYLDPAGILAVTVHIRQFENFPATDWVMEFENRGSADAPILEAILPLDLAVPLPPEERLRLHHANGSACRMDDFLPLTTEISPGACQTLSPRGGRSSDGTLPFMNLQRAGGGLVLAIGWSGQWAATLERSKDALRLAAGMERTHLALRAGEKIRTPRILLLPWEGDDEAAGRNLLRRLLLAHYLPRIGGELVMPPTAQCLQFYYYLTGKAGESLEMTALPKAAALGLEVYWIDACWFGDRGQWWEEVGSWVVNREKFPHGLRPISDAARKAGMKFLLWFEPERVRKTSRIAREHPEHLLRNPADPDNLLFNLGSPEALAYITNILSRQIEENGVDIYRQDFNFEPLGYWRAADGPDRIGMAEIRHVEGLYALWDELRRRHPGLWIDNCSSGGRRIDLETLSRSLPLWSSDFLDTVGLPFGQGLHVGSQCIKAGLARWVPLFGGGVWDFTPYGVRSQGIGGFTFGCHIDPRDFPADDAPSTVTSNAVMAKGKTLLGDGFPLEAARAAVAEWRSLRPFFLGDFYLLLPLTVSYHDWCAWQFHREDLDAGVAMFLRRHRSPFPAMEVTLRGIEAGAWYNVSLSPEFQEAPRQRIRGKDLVRMTVEISEAPGSVLLRYTRAP